MRLLWFQWGHFFSEMDRIKKEVRLMEELSEFPMENQKNQIQETSYPPPSDDLFRSGLFTEISSSTRMRAFFRLLSLIP